MTPSNTVAKLSIDLLPALSSADLLDLVGAALTEMGARGDDIELRNGSIMSQWAEISYDEKRFRPVFHDLSIAEQASKFFGGAAA